MGRTSALRRRVAVLSTATRRWSRRGREVLLGKLDLPKSATARAKVLQIDRLLEISPALVILPALATFSTTLLGLHDAAV